MLTPRLVRWISDWHERRTRRWLAKRSASAVTTKLDGPVCRYCGADCSEGRSWDGGDLYACPPCADKRAAANHLGQSSVQCTVSGCLHPSHPSYPRFFEVGGGT